MNRLSKVSLLATGLAAFLVLPAQAAPVNVSFSDIAWSYGGSASTGSIVSVTTTTVAGASVLMGPSDPLGPVGSAGVPTGIPDNTAIASTAILYDLDGDTLTADDQFNINIAYSGKTQSQGVGTNLFAGNTAFGGYDLMSGSGEFVGLTITIDALTTDNNYNTNASFLGFTELDVYSIGSTDNYTVTLGSVTSAAVTDDPFTAFDVLTFPGADLTSNFVSMNKAAGSVGLSNFAFDIAVDLTPVPEPSSLALLGLGSFMIARRRRG